MPLARTSLNLCLLAMLLLAAGCNRHASLVSQLPPPPFATRPAPARVAATAPTPVVSSRRWPAPAPVAPSAAARCKWTPTGFENKWRFIIVHHSASASGNAAIFNQSHIVDRGWDELGYHFVIGNGSRSGNGQIEIGPRWTKQKRGAHCGVRDHPEYNEYGIGICLVGNFDVARPSPQQMDSLAWLVRGLMDRYNIPKSRVLGHGMLKGTDCPGKNFSFKDLYGRL